MLFAIVSGPKGQTQLVVVKWGRAIPNFPFRSNLPSKWGLLPCQGQRLVTIPFAMVIIYLQSSSNVFRLRGRIRFTTVYVYVFFYLFRHRSKYLTRYSRVVVKGRFPIRFFWVLVRVQAIHAAAIYMSNFSQGSVQRSFQFKGRTSRIRARSVGTFFAPPIRRLGCPIPRF